MTYDDGIERAIALVNAFKCPEDISFITYKAESINRVFDALIDALKAEKSDADE